VQDLLDELKYTDDFDLSLMAAVIVVAHSNLAHLSKLNHQLLEAVRKEEKNRSYYKKRSNIKRKRRANLLDDESDTWGEDVDDIADTRGEDFGGSTPTKFVSWKKICDSVSNRVFRRKFRMTKSQFKLLCTKIRDKVGKEKFRSTNSQAICGYTQVAIGLQILC